MDVIGPGKRIVQQVEQQIRARSFRASNELRNAALRVLRGQRSGRRYRVPFTRGNFMRNRKRTRRHARWYTASAPGEPPAMRTGTFRGSWWPRPRAESQPGGAVAYPGIYTPFGKLAEYLEDGTRNMRPRPYVDRIKARAMPRIRRIYQEPYT